MSLKLIYTESNNTKICVLFKKKKSRYSRYIKSTDII